MANDRIHRLRANVFCDKVEPIPTGSIFGKCSYCVFRNMKLYCDKLKPVCTYISQKDEDFDGAVYWSAKNTGDGYGFLMCHPPVWGVKFFTKTPTPRIQKIAGKMVIKALREQNQK